MGFKGKPGARSLGGLAMAIYSLHHAAIGKATQARPYTAAAHVRYIARKSACSRLIGERMPVKSASAQGWFRQQEAADRKNARVCDKVLLALPRELNAEQRAALVQSFAEKVTAGRASWLAAFHDRGNDRHNPHCHLVIRDRDPDTGRRVNNMSERGSTDVLRRLWEEHANGALSQAGRAELIDRRSLAAQGVRRRPTIHEGLSSREMIAKGRQVRSRPINVRNSVGAHTPERVVDYRRFDRGRSRPAHNRHIQETEVDYWAALDAEDHRREMESLRAIHRPDLVNVGPVPGPRTKEVHQEAVVPTITPFLLKPVSFPPSGTSSLNIGKPVLEPAAERIAWGERQKKFADALGPRPIAFSGRRGGTSRVTHTESMNRPSEFVKGTPMIDDEESRNRKRKERDNAQHTADRDQAHYNNLMERSYLDPASAEKKMNAHLAKHGDQSLHDELSKNSRKTAFGRRPGSILSKDGYAEGAASRRQDSQIARQSLPDAVSSRNVSRDRLAAAERAAVDAEGQPSGRAKPTPQVHRASRVSARDRQEGELFSTRTGPGGDHSYAPVAQKAGDSRDPSRDFDREGKPLRSFSQTLADRSSAPKERGAQEKEKTSLLERWRCDREKDKERGR